MTLAQPRPRERWALLEAGPAQCPSLQRREALGRVSYPLGHTLCWWQPVHDPEERLVSSL